MHVVRRLSVIPFVLSILGGCNALDRLSHVGAEPPLSPVGQHTERASRQPVTMPMPAVEGELIESLR